jgi:hypothetical protein
MPIAQLEATANNAIVIGNPFLNAIGRPVIFAHLRFAHFCSFLLILFRTREGEGHAWYRPPRWFRRIEAFREERARCPIAAPCRHR